MKPKLNCILIIDDDEPTNFFTRIILEEAACAEHIKIVQSGREALDYLTISKSEAADFPGPDLILLDINMPAMNGWEFLEEYKKLDISYRVTVIMVTTSLFPEDKLKAERMPEISDFLNKPITIEKMDQIVEKYFAIEISK